MFPELAITGLGDGPKADSEPYQSLKVGYAGQNFPEHQYPSIVGRPILRTEERQGDIVQTLQFHVWGGRERDKDKADLE